VKINTLIRARGA